MEDNLRRDRTRATIQSFSNLGLLEFTRKRVGKDLGAQLRGTCPTCIGLGSVMSPQSVAIETFRRIRGEAAAGAPGDVVVHVAPTVAMQMEFWYEEECTELARSIEHPIRVRVDPMIHPEKARIEIVAGFEDKRHALRVGDEHDVDLLPGRLPSPLSAAAVVDGRIAEVENAINNAGNFARIRIIDVDDEDDYVLAELVTAAVKSRRKRHGRREKLSAAEQTRQLRELAEDAARQSASRPPIGISPVTEEEEAQDKALRAERKGEAQPDAIIIAEGAVQHGDGDGHRKRRRRRRGRSVKERIEETVVSVAAPPPAEAAAAAGDGTGQQRRRRRRRRGRGGRGQRPGAVPDRNIFEVGPNGETHSTGVTAPPEPSRAIVTRSAAPPAVGPPPPSLSAPAEETKRTKPARRRRPARSEAAGELEGTASPIALPAAETKRRRTRKTGAAGDAQAPSEPKPKRTRVSRSAAAATDGETKKPARKRATASRKKSG